MSRAPLLALALLLPVVAVAAQSMHAESSFVSAPVATRRLPRGTALTESDMMVARVAVRGAGPVVPAGPGWVTRRIIQPGEVLQPPAVAPARLLVPGQAVQLTVETEGVALTMPGVALTAGDLGSTVSVRVGDRRRLKGRVTGRARVLATP